MKTEGHSRTLLLPGLALMATACLALAGLAVYQVRWIAPELSRIQSGIARSFEVIKSARQLEQTLAESERGVRNYLVTRDSGQLVEYRKLLEGVPSEVSDFRRLAGTDYAGSMTVLDKEVERTRSQLRQMVEAYEREGADGARNALRGHLESDPLHAIGATIDSIVGAENARLAGLQAEAKQHERTFAGAAFGAGVLALFVMAFGAFELVKAFRDVRRAAEEQRISEEQFRLFVSGVTDYAVYTMDPVGRVTSWNAGAERIKGYAAREILGRNFARFYTEADQKAGVPARALETAAREGRWETEARRVRKNGTVFWAHVVLDPIRDSSGRLLGFVKVTRDVSERRAQQEALEQARSALAQAQKMEAVGQLTGGIAHDFNNLLTVIMGSLEALERRLHSGRLDVTKFIETARRGAERAADLVQRLLTFARRQPLEPRPVQPNRLVASVAGWVRRGLSESITLETLLAPGAWWISADQSQLESAILNLALNARDAMPAGGRLTIETANTLLDGAYARANPDVAPGEYTMISVTDTGAGMTPDTIARAFEPFFTTKDVGAGSGLGLSQVYGFVKQSRGHVKIYSEPGTGTTVKLYFRRLEGPVPEDTSDEAAPSAQMKGGEAILLVEDDDDVRRFTAESLGELGYRVRQARDAASALQALEEPEPVDLLFTDIGLPGGVNGRELADAARKRKPRLKVLFTSGYARDTVVKQGVLDTSFDFVGKPFTQTGLARRVREALDREQRPPRAD